MGLFKKKKSTSVEVTNKNLTLSKIVKFSYLQTLAIDGGLSSVKQIAGETSGTSETTNSSSTNNSLINKLIDARADILNTIIPGLGKLGSSVAKSLFGKKITSDTKIDSSESGWTVTKIWNQPQFDIIRYAIGIKELTISQFTYKETSEFVSTAWASPKEIIKITSVVDQFIPPLFPYGTYIKYYIKPNVPDTQWIQINPLGLPSLFNEDGSIVPRIINFNTEKPLTAKFEDAYFYTTSPVKDVVFRAVFSRPSSLEGTTADANGYSPILKSYRLLLYPRDGL